MINNIKPEEMLSIGKKLNTIFKNLNIPVKEIYFIGSRVNNRAKITSDLDVVVIPKVKSWNSPQEYTKLMKSINSYISKLKFRGNNIDIQLSGSFDSAESWGDNYVRLKSGIIKEYKGIKW